MKLAQNMLASSLLMALCLTLPGAAATAQDAEPEDSSTQPSEPTDEPTAEPSEEVPVDFEVEPDGGEPVNLTIGAPDVVVAPTAGPPTEPPTQRNYVAVVIGISAYQNLPDAVELDFGRSDAATVAQTLRTKGAFDQVFLLGDGEATREAIKETLRTEVAQFVGPDDVLLLYYAGHGIGADLGLPVLLTADSTLENGQNDGFEVTEFARDLQTWTQAGTTLLVTDVVHRNQLDGIYFYGPAADSWPALPKNWMVLSATQANKPGKDGAFAPIFSDAISGAADANRDTFVTAAELFGYVVTKMSPTGQIPLAAGEYDGGMVIAQGVRGQPEPDPEPAPEPVAPPPPEVIVEQVTVWPDYSVNAAKFVWEGGSGQSVQCREQPVMACEGNCYVRDFKAGPCELEAIFDGVKMTGMVPVLGPGKYDCRRKGGALECSGP